MEIDIVAEFIGGPHDGVIQQLYKLNRRWLFPVIENPIIYPPKVIDIPMENQVTSKASVYGLVLTFGHPSINDRGYYRYEFKGYQ